MKKWLGSAVVLLLVAVGVINMDQARDLLGGAAAPVADESTQAPAPSPTTPSEPAVKSRAADGSQVADSPRDLGRLTSRGKAYDSTSLMRAIAARRSDVQVTGTAPIKRILPDDNEGSRHQRFLIDVGQGRTVLIAHNIDLAPRVPLPRVGANISFHGEFEWNDRGGVVHWTHHDPKGWHEGGWLEYGGKRYE